MSIKGYLPELLLYLILSPIVGGFAVRIGRLIQVRFGEPRRSERIDSHGAWLRLLGQAAPRERKAAGLLVLLYWVAVAVGGCLYIVEANLVWVLTAFTVGGLFLIGGLVWRRPDGWRELVDRECLRLFAFIAVFSLVTLGLYLFAGYAGGAGTFRIKTITGLASPPVLQLPGLLPGLLVYIIFGARGSFPKLGYPPRTARPGYAGRELFLLQWGRWYEDVFLFVFLFRFHFGQSLLSGIAAAGVCLMAALLRASPISRLFHRRPARLKYYVTALICLLPALINLYLLL